VRSKIALLALIIAAHPLASLLVAESAKATQLAGDDPYRHLAGDFARGVAPIPSATMNTRGRKA
jgi:hypothetical protein